MGVMMPLFLYANDLTLMSERTAGLQGQFALIVEREKHWSVKYFQDDSHSSLILFGTLQPEYVYAQYLCCYNIAALC